jgi:hypothetical protein
MESPSLSPTSVSPVVTSLLKYQDQAMWAFCKCLKLSRTLGFGFVAYGESHVWVQTQHLNLTHFSNYERDYEI